MFGLELHSSGSRHIGKLRPVNLASTKPKTPSPPIGHVALEPQKTAGMACLLAGAYGTDLLLETAMLAARELGGDLYVACVCSPSTLFSKATTILMNRELIHAGSLGAKTVWLESRDVAGAFLDFARQAGVSRIFVSRTPPRPFYRAFLSSPYCDLLRRGEGFRIEVVGFAHRR